MIMNTQNKISKLVLGLIAGLGATDGPGPEQHFHAGRFGHYANNRIETGPVLDVVPYVLSDGYTINLTLIPSLTEFNGYDTPPDIPNVTGGLNVVQLPVVLPDFTVRQVVTTVNIWDNQTVVIGGLISSQVQTKGQGAGSG